MQDVSFKTIDEFFNYLPKDELKVVKQLRKIVLQCMPHAKEKLSWNIPTYTIHKSICFIRPASVKWGKKESYTGVRFGFMHGNLLNPNNKYFDLGNRKMVSYRDFQNIKDIDEDILRTTLFEAVFVDEQFAKKLKKK